MVCYQRKVQLIREGCLKERAIGVTKTNTLRARLLKTSLWAPHQTIMCLQMLYDLTFAVLDFNLVLVQVFMLFCYTHLFEWECILGVTVIANIQFPF